MRSKFFAPPLSVRPGLCVFFVFLLVSVGVLTTPAQAQSVAERPDRVIDAKMQLEVIDSVTQALNEIYVFPDVAKKMEKYLHQQYKKKTYENINSLEEFTQKLTEDLREISHDWHLSVRFASDEFLASIEDTITDEEKKHQFESRRRNNFCFKEAKLLEGNVGYLDLRCFSDTAYAQATAVATMNFLANTDAIILDLRNNDGGHSSMSQLITSYFFSEPVQLNSIYIRKSDSIEHFWTQAQVEGPRMPDVDLYVLTSNYTASAAEGFSYNLKNLKRATIIGEKTEGAAHPFERRIFRNLNIIVHLPYGRAVSPITGTNWEGTGVIPDIDVPQAKALDVAHLEALKKLLGRTKDPDWQVELQWAIEGLQVKLNPVTVERSQLEAYIGQYGPRKIWLEGDRLYYQRGEGTIYILTPMGDHRFMLEGLDNFRIQFSEDEKGEINELIGQYSDGFTESHKRSE